MMPVKQQAVVRVHGVFEFPGQFGQAEAGAVHDGRQFHGQLKQFIIALLNTRIDTQANMIDKITNLLLASIVVVPAVLLAAELERDPLFHIARNKNANIIQYDAQVGANGMLDSKTPVVGYWIRLAEQGQIKKLTWTQKKFAFGFKAKLNKNENTVALDMVLDLDRTIQVTRVGENYRAITDINGVESYIDKIYLHASGKGISTRVEYIELHGTSLNGQIQQYERFTP